MIKVIIKEICYESKILAKIGKGTKRKNREINLLEVAKEIKSIYLEVNSLSKVANIVKLSPEMVRQFLKINDLDNEIKKLIKNNLIKGVDIGYRISMLKGTDQIILANNVISKNLTSADVREIVKYKKQNPNLPIDKVIDKNIKSKNKKIYVLYLNIENKIYQKFIINFKNEI